MLADLGRRLRFEPDDVGYILPFEEVVEALGRVSEHDLGLQTHPARLDRRHRRPHEGVRPRLPPHEPAPARALAADRGGPAPRRVVPADLRLPHRRAALRPRRPSPRLGRALARPRGHRRLRDRGPDARRPGRRRARLGPPDQGPRAPVPRARPARPRAPQPDQALRSLGLRLARRGRRGLGLPRHAGPPRVHGPRGGRAPVVRRGLQAGHGDARRRPSWSSAARRRPTPTCGSSPRATCCCARTTGPTRCSSGCAPPSGGASAARACRPGAAAASARPTERRHAPGPGPGRAREPCVRPTPRRRGCRRPRAGCSGGEAAAAVGVEQLDLGDVEHHLDLLAGVGLALRVEARDDVGGAAARARAGQLAQAGVLGQRGELLGLRRLRLDVEVGVELGAHRLDDVDRDLELHAAGLALVGDRGVLEVLGAQARDHVARPAVAALDLRLELLRQLRRAERQLERVARRASPGGSSWPASR